MKKYWIWWVFWTVFTLAVCGVSLGTIIWLRFQPDEHGRIVPPFDKVDMSFLPSFIEGMVMANNIVVYEGLPHDGWEVELYQSERKNKKTRKIHGYYFYEQALDFAEEDKALIRSLNTVEPLFVEWGGMKLCGGYHPDYAIEWQAKQGPYFALICFGCHEVKLFSPKGRLYCDIPDATVKVLKRSLLRYRVNRPQDKEN